MRVLVVGAGVGGLGTARALSAAGHEVTVCEQASALRTSGAGFTLWSNGTGVCDELDVSLDGVGAPIEVLEQHDADGRVLVRIDVARAVRRYGKPHICLPRRRLLERLADGLPSETVSFDRDCIGIDTDDGQVRAFFADGGVETADLLVGADGHHSAIRRHLWDGDPTRPTGWATWQGLSAVPIDITFSRRSVMIVGRAGVCGLMPAGENLLQWWFDVRWSPDDPYPQSPVADLRRRFGHWTAPPVRDVLEAISDEEVELFPHYAHRVPRVWGAGRSTLVGDAAHTVSPTQAQGANQALEDAWALRRTLRSVGDTPADIPDALRRYEHLRSRRARLVARLAATDAPNDYRPIFLRLIPESAISLFHTFWLKQISTYLADRG